MALDNLRGGTKRVVEENTPLNNLRGGTKRVVIVDGGGGSVDYAKTVQRAESMPTADSSNAGQQFLYSGESDATYTHGYIYENVATTTSSSASAEQTVGSTLSDIAVDLATLESFTGWTTDNSLQIFYTADGWSVDTTSLGVTYTGTPNVGDAITITYTAESTSYAWIRVDVQPAGATYTAGNGISIDANNEISVTAPTLTNVATGTGKSVNILGYGTTGNDAVAIGNNSTTGGSSSCVALGASSQSTNNSVAVGWNATAGNQNTIVVGKQSTGNMTKSVVLGASSVAYPDLGSGESGIAIGYYTKSGADHAIQIGNDGTNNRTTNSDANTFKVANANGNFEIMSADGTIPEARLADTTNAAQGQVLTLDSNLNAVWQASSGGDLPSQTGNAGKFLTTDGTDASWSDKPLVNNSSAYESVSIFGNGATGIRAVTIGAGSGASGGYGIAIGRTAKANANWTIAMGDGATAGGANSILLNVSGGSVTNSDANTFKVANENGNFMMMDANGNLPADRLASTSGLADGNYRLRLVMASGVPTLEWVAE